MDTSRFDALIQRLGAFSSRRTTLGVLLGGAAALLTGAAALDAKKGGKGKGKGQPKVTFCHATGQDNQFTLISVGGPAAKAHRKHGDTECIAGTCQTGGATGCNTDGTCVFAKAAKGATCVVEGQSGACNADGVCKI